MADWRKLSAAELGRGIASGGIDPVALTDMFLAAIDAEPARDRIFARLTPERARAEALAARERAKAGLRRHPLDGVPISWKDNFDSAGIATEAGSALLKGRVPKADATVLATATAQGSVSLGKTHLTELAFSGLGLNPITATPPNALEPSLAPGGSSSGAAVATALGLAAAGIGSDTGGSVRVPAAWNDLVGLKTTAGRLPLTGVVPLAESFDTVGPLAKTVEDAALLLGLLEGSKPADLSGASLAGCRFLVLENALQATRDAPGAAFEAGLVKLSKSGAKIDRASLSEIAEALSFSPILFGAEAYGTWKDAIEAAPDKMFPQVLARFRGGKGFSGADFVAAWQRLRRLRGLYLTATAEYDAVLLPTTPNLPPDAARLLAEPDYFVSENLLTLSNTRIANLLGLAALSLPTATPQAGFMLMTAPLSEARLLRLGAAAEPILR